MPARSNASSTACRAALLSFSCSCARLRISDACHWSMTIRFDTSPCRMPACTAAPSATASSGSMSSGSGARPVMCVMKRRTAGMRVAPPTSSTLVTAARPRGRTSCFSISCFHCGTPRRAMSSRFSCSAIIVSFRSTPACQHAASSGSRARRKSSSERASSRSRASVTRSGPPPGPPSGILSTTLSCSDSCTLAYSASARRLDATAGTRVSMPAGCRCSASSHATMAASQSSPPRWGSPPVDSTSTVPLPTSSRLMSYVPPPRSNTSTTCSSSRSRP
ncbi:MAG: hypothetical protein J3K34DRAFT_398087 [Monoraphidium minutum]|nr:MAG: hypothetical protein J3K34DRAFT_398087 [Monoraphidium minutum]